MKYPKAKICSHVGKTTESFVYFSTTAGERSAADAERKVRGFDQVLRHILSPCEEGLHSI
jgi:catalase